jgi:hypothetical protein
VVRVRQRESERRGEERRLTTACAIASEEVERCGEEESIHHGVDQDRSAIRPPVGLSSLSHRHSEADGDRERAMRKEGSEESQGDGYLSRR